MIPTHRDFRTVQFQAAAFTPGGQVAVTRVLVALLARWASLFSADPLVIPTSTGAPVGVPTIVLRSPNNRHRFQITADRADYFWTVDDQFSSLDGAEFVRSAHELLDFYIDVAQTRVIRLALICGRVLSDQTPTQTLLSCFFAPSVAAGPLADSVSIEINSHRLCVLDDRFKINSILKIRSGSTISPVSLPVSQSQFIVEQDVNTMAETASEESFTGEQREQFFSLAVQHMSAGLIEVFPGEVSQ
jgi:hypothetical protein